MIVYSDKFYKIGINWLDQLESKSNNIDIIKHYKSQKKPDKFLIESSHTIKIDLTKSHDDILIGFNKNTRYEIRRAEGDGLLHNWISTPKHEDILLFLESFNEFAASKGLAAINGENLYKLSSTGALALSTAQKDRQNVVWHAYYLGKTTAVLLHSASLFRNEEVSDRQMIGRANRWLHWYDMVFLKKSGISTYDFGGWYGGQSDQVLLQINKFKEGFGGDIVEEFNYFTPVTMKGYMVLSLKKLFKQI